MNDVVSLGRDRSRAGAADGADDAAAAMRAAVARRGPAIEVVPPEAVSLPLVVASPHSGRDYPADFLAGTHLGLPVLRRAEDAFVDELFDAAPLLGAPLLRARFPRSYVDVNREAYELDPTMFEGPMPPETNSRSARVAAGLGVIPRVAATGEAIYRRRLAAAEIELRLEHAWRPYHTALRRLIGDARARFGVAVLIDGHSMPSAAYPAESERRSRVDFVLGDNHGASCAPALIDGVSEWLRRQGYRVAHNQPYAGGFITQTYGSPAGQVHALQIEINRALYLDEQRVVRSTGFTGLRHTMREMLDMIGRLVLDHAAFRMRAAAE